MFDEDQVLKLYLFYALNKCVEEVKNNLHGGVGLVHITKGNLQKIKIPLPSLKEQKQIIDELEGYQKIIEGCKQVIANYKPIINLDPSWENTIVGNIFENVTKTIKPEEINYTTTKYVGLEHIEKGTGNLVSNFTGEIDEIKSNKIMFKSGDILYAKLRPNLNKVVLVDFDGICSTDILVWRPKETVSGGFYHSIFLSEWFNKQVMRGISGAQLPRTKFSFIAEIKVPFPNKNVQDSFYNSITKEKDYINSTKKLIELYTKKIQNKISKIWNM